MKIYKFSELSRASVDELLEMHEVCVRLRHGETLEAPYEFLTEKYGLMDFYKYHLMVLFYLNAHGVTTYDFYKELGFDTKFELVGTLSALDFLSVDELRNGTISITNPFVTDDDAFTFVKESITVKNPFAYYKYETPTWDKIYENLKYENLKSDFSSYTLTYTTTTGDRYWKW